MAMATTTKLKHATFVQQARHLSVGNLNVFHALMVAQIVHLKIILHLTSPVLHVYLIMGMLTVAAHYVLEIKLLKVGKPFALIAQVDVTSVMAPFAPHARATISYPTILVKFVLIALSHWEEIPLNVLPAVAIALLAMQLAALPVKTAPL